MSKASGISRVRCYFDAQSISDVWVNSDSKASSPRVSRVVFIENKTIKSEPKFLNKALNKRILEKIADGEAAVSEICQKCRDLEISLLEAIASNPKYGVQYLGMKVQPDGHVCIELKLELIRMLWESLGKYRRWFNITPDLIIKIHKNCPSEMSSQIRRVLTSLAKRHNVELAYFNAGKNSGFGFVCRYNDVPVSDEIKATFNEEDMREQFPDYILDLVDECVEKAIPGKKFTLSSMTHWSEDGVIRVSIPISSNIN
ncbi:MAG: hypothetical protein K2L13_03095 [Opitutales bacterium]|nr:hypothetical protein [Opitutales bacterium]